MTLQEQKSFIENLIAQQRINREVHGNTDADDKKSAIEWSLIVGEHYGHLLGCLRKDDNEGAKKEILHVVAPLLEAWNALMTQRQRRHSYKCKVCGETFSLSEKTNRCPMCEGVLEELNG